jgi:hypothetical protein
VGYLIRPAVPTDAPALARLDQRLAAAGTDVRVYPPDAPRPVVADEPSEQYFVVQDGDEIRGSVYLRRSTLFVGDTTLPIAWVKYPVSESLVDRRFAAVPAAMILFLQREFPNVLAVGMGGLQGTFAQLLDRFRWSGHVVPTLVLPLHPSRVIRQLPQLATRGRLRQLAAAADRVGAGAVASWGVRAIIAGLEGARLRGASVLPVGTPNPDYDTVFTRARAQYATLADRRAAAVRWSVPADVPGVTHQTVHVNGATVGWVAVQFVDLRTLSSPSPYGALRVGVLHDMLAAPTFAAPVVAAGVRVLRRAGADLIIANHSHPTWLHALRGTGFLNAPPSFACMLSPALTAALSARGVHAHDLYLTRGDDGVLRFV